MIKPNILIDELPESVEIDGKEWQINTDFRVGILFELCIQDDTLSDMEQALTIINLVFPNIPNNLPAAMEAAIWFYRCGEESDTKKANATEEEAPRQKLIYSFEHDADWIYAAFLETYGIDLSECSMHWWKFKALLRALPETAQFVKIMGYRSMKITDTMSKKEKEYYRKMKKIYALPLSATEKEYTDKLTAALINGDDLKGLI